MLISLGGPIHDQLQSYFNKLNPTNEALILTPPVTPTEAPPINRLDVGGTDSGEIRSIVWSGAIKIWQRYPILGSGVETFAYSYYLDRPIAHNIVSEWDFLYNKAHNEFLNYLATTGLLGLLTYCALLGWFGWKTLRWSFTSNAEFSDRLLGLALVCSVLGLSVSNFFGFSTVAVTVMMYLWFALANILSTDVSSTNQQSKSKTKATSSPHSTSSGWQLEQAAAMVLVWLAVLIGWWQIYQTFMADHWYTLGKNFINQGQLDVGAGYIQMAAKASPQEGLFADELSITYAQLAISLFSQGQTETANQLAQAALLMSDEALRLNPAQLNFHRTRVRVFLTLAQANPALAEEADRALVVAQTLAPTDAKLVYYQSTIAHDLGNQEKAIQLLEKTISMKPNYEEPRMMLATILWRNKQQPTQALEQVEYVLQYIAPNNQKAKDLKAEIATVSAKSK
jgi:hypothetical protein